MPFLLTKNIKIDRFWSKNWKLAKNFWKLDINIEFEVETQGKNPKLKGKTQPLGSSFSACATKWCYKKKPVLSYNYQMRLLQKAVLYSIGHFLFLISVKPWRVPRPALSFRWVSWVNQSLMGWDWVRAQGAETTPLPSPGALSCRSSS